MKQDLHSKMQDELGEKISDLFESVASSRSEHYRKNPGEIKSVNEIPRIIRSYTQTNATISGAASLIPGPWGMLALIPEVVTIIRNQITMIYDIGQAHGKERFLTKELLAGVFLTALGTSATSLLVLHGGKVLVKRASLRAFQKVIALLAGKITQQVLKSTINKWLPVVGAAAMASWSAYLTNKIGKKAHEIFSQEIILETEFVDEEQNKSSIENDDLTVSSVKPAIHTQIAKIENSLAVNPEVSINTNVEARSTIALTKIHSLIQLVKMNGVIQAEDKKFILDAIQKAKLNPAELKQISIFLKTDSKIDYSIFKNFPEDSISLLMDLVMLAHRDGSFHITKKMYVKQVGRLLGFSDSDIEEIILSVA